MIRTKSITVLTLVMLIAATFAWAASVNTVSAKDAKVKGDVVFEFSATFNGQVDADEVARRVVIAANIGSRGLDGVRLPQPDFQVDSFFDVFYEIDYSGSTGTPSTTIDIEMVALSLSGVSPVPVIDKGREELRVELKNLDEFSGHVTILK